MSRSIDTTESDTICQGR